MTSNGTELQIVVREFKPFTKNTLKGFATILLPAVGLVLFECPFHEREDGRKWLGLPARSYEKNGKKEWMRLAECADKDAHYRFQNVAVKAVEDFLAKS